MYRITNVNTGVDLGAVDKVVYIKIGESGDFTPAKENEAVGVALDSVPYNLVGHEEINGADTVVVSEFDGAKAIQEMASYAELAKAIREGVNEV